MIDLVDLIVFVMQVTSALAVIAGGVLVFSHVFERKSAAAPSFDRAGDFEIDHRRVLAFARLAVRR